MAISFVLYYCRMSYCPLCRTIGLTCISSRACMPWSTSSLLITGVPDILQTSALCLTYLPCAIHTHLCYMWVYPPMLFINSESVLFLQLSTPPLSQCMPPLSYSHMCPLVFTQACMPHPHICVHTFVFVHTPLYLCTPPLSEPLMCPTLFMCLSHAPSACTSLHHMPHSPPTPMCMCPWTALSPLAAKCHCLNSLDAKGHGQHCDDHVVMPAPFLAAQFC
jgi:hypothetical protein